MPTVALAIPDPRIAPVPRGWATDTFAPEADTLDWPALDEAEAQLLALASYIESMRGDNLELRKALRIVECRRGVLMGEARAGARTDLQPLPRVVEVRDVSSAQATRYRKIARHWDAVAWPRILSATAPHDVTQTAILALIDEHIKNEVGPSTNGHHVEPNPDNPDYDPADDALDPVVALAEALAEVERLTVLNDALSVSDLGGEVRKWAAKYAQLEGRVMQQSNQVAVLKKQLFSHTKAMQLLEKIRDLLKVERDGEIVDALTDLLR